MTYKAQSTKKYSNKDLLEKLCKSWFSSIWSTEFIMRGTANQSAVITILSKQLFVENDF